MSRFLKTMLFHNSDLAARVAGATVVGPVDENGSYLPAFRQVRGTTKCCEVMYE